MRIVKITLAGTLVACGADDPDALVLFTPSEARDNVLRRDLIRDETVAAVKRGHDRSNEPAVMQVLSRIVMGVSRSPLEQPPQPPA